MKSFRVHFGKNNGSFDLFLYPYFFSLLVIVHMQDFARNVVWSGCNYFFVQHNCAGLHETR